MYAVIETNGANKIVIGIPHEGAEKSLPALAAMLEKNAVFVTHGHYQTPKIVEPTMEIHLGERFDMGKDESHEVVVAFDAHPSIIGDDFVIATPDVFTRNAKALKEAEEKTREAREKIQSLEVQLREANSEVLRLRAQLAPAEEGTEA